MFCGVSEVKKPGVRAYRRVVPLRCLCLLLVWVAVFAAGECRGEDSGSLSFEMKFLLDPAQALTGGGPTAAMQEQFALEAERTVDLIFLETADRDFGQQGWINRIRWKTWKKKPEYTFKKRFPVTGENYNAALERARGEGLTGATFEVDWGYSSMTLSATWEDDKKYGEYTSLSQFTTGDAMAYAAKWMPEAEKNWSGGEWGTEKLAKAQKIGPLQMKRAKGTWADEREVTLDIIEIPGSGQVIAELSFKVEDDYATAAELRSRMMAELDGMGVLQKKDSLKTQAIIEACLLAEPENPDCVLPEALTRLEQGALDGCAFQYVRVGAGAELEENALPEGVIIIGTPGSSADQYATDHGCGFIPE